jgi:antitoxin (DNA-binding transcriptional repressor) of toxin-antitoxin stability system
LTLSEFNEHFDAVMDSVVNGGSFIISIDGREVADLTPCGEADGDREVSGTA